MFLTGSTLKALGKLAQKTFGALLVENWSNWILLNHLKICEFHLVINLKL